MAQADTLVRATSQLSKAVEKLSFDEPITYIYNPLDYAKEIHNTYLRRYANNNKKIIFLGMNPGPFGMAQCGIPFGEINHVRDWLGLEGPVKKPNPEHPKRPIDGFACTKSEVSGRRLWGAFADRFETAENFFTDHFVTNYCPLVFMEESSRNFTPDKLPKAKQTELFAPCDKYLKKLCETLNCTTVIGVGAFAKQRAEAALTDTNLQIGQIMHPSPANPHANRGWQAAIEKQMAEQGFWK